METTYRLVVLGEERDNVGRTALTPELAKLAPGDLSRGGNSRLGIERTDWVEHFDKVKPLRTILVEAEREPGEWVVGAS